MGDDTRDTITPEALAEIERRTEEATPGPWSARVRHHRNDWVVDSERVHQLCELRGVNTSANLSVGADAALIAAARSDVPRLCASLRAAWAERDEAWEEVEDVVAEAREIKDAQDALLAERDALRAEVKRLRGEAESLTEDIICPGCDSSGDWVCRCGKAPIPLSEWEARRRG
jgi:hypothetical protein